MSSDVIMVLRTIIFVVAFRRWFQLVQIESTVTDKYGDQVLVLVREGGEETSKPGGNCRGSSHADCDVCARRVGVPAATVVVVDSKPGRQIAA